MKIWFILLLSSLCSHTIHAQPFTGHIQYETFYANTNARDTFDLFVGEKVIIYKDGNYTKHTAPHFIHLLDENKRYLYMKIKGEWSWLRVPEVNNRKMFINKPVFIKRETFLDADCEVYSLSRQMQDEQKSLTETEKVWISKAYAITDVDDFTPYERTFFNKTGSIILKLTRETNRIPTAADEAPENIYSAMTALFINPVLPKEYFEILAEFQKWRNGN